MRQRSGGGQGLAGPGRAPRPSIARIIDHYLGGAGHCEVDRRVAAELAAALPSLPAHVRELRGFVQRAVRHLAEQGVEQFLDLGTGLCTLGGVHAPAQRINPGSRVVHVEADPLTVRMAEACLDAARGVAVVHADLRAPASVLTSPGVAALLDFTRPVAVLATAVLPFIAEDAELVGVLAAYRDACPQGSALVAAQLSPVGASPERIERTGEVAARAGGRRPAWRSAESFRAVFDGYELLEPGIVHTPQWRPDEPVPAEAAGVDSLAGVGLVACRKSTGPPGLAL